MNDATALILYRTAVMAAVSGTFILSDTVLDFFMAAGVGVVVGLLVGVVARWGLRLMKDSFSEIAITLLSPYIRLGLGRTGSRFWRPCVRGRRSLSSPTFQRGRCADDKDSSEGRVGLPCVRAQRSHFYSNRPAARRAP